MSLLSSFTSDFNRKLTHYRKSEKADSIGQRKKSYEKVGIIDGLLLPNKADYQNSTSNQKIVSNVIIYDIFEYKFRCEFGPTITKGDILQDDFGKWYEVKRVIRNPGFGGDDHLLCYLNECDGIQGK